MGQKLFFEKISGQEIDPSTSIHGIAKDSVGYIWFGSWNGAYRYDGKSFDFYSHNPNDKTSLPNNRIRNIVSDKKLGLWFLTFDHKYAKFNYKLNTFSVVDKKAVPNGIVTGLSNNSNILNKDKIVNRNVYYLTAHQFISQDLKTKKETQYFANINEPGSLLDDFITSFLIDNENIIWLGTRGGDIYKANPNRNPFDLHYSYIIKNQKTKLAAVRAILKEDNSIWLGTDEGILIYNENGLDKSHRFYKSGSTINQVRTLFKDCNGGIWIGGTNGLEFYDPKSNQTRQIIRKGVLKTIEPVSVFAIEPHANKGIWVGLYNGIAYIDFSNFHLEYFNLQEKINDHSVMDILSINDHRIWLATEGNGIVQLEIDNKKGVKISSSKLPLNSKTSGNMIYALQKDKKGNVWAGTSDGLYKMDSKAIKIEKIKLLSDKPNTYISSITDDQQGNIWIAHKEGISQINASSGEISNYQKKDQFNSWRFLERAIYKDPTNNRIYFGGKNGYVSFDPRNIKAPSVSNKLILKSLYVLNQEVTPLDTIWERPILAKTLSQTQDIQLDYESRSFAIEFSSFNYYDSRKEVFEYILEGFDDNWTKTSNHKISFNKIPPGSYTFKVRLLTPNAVNMPEATLDINVSAPWYGTWLAKIIFLVLIATLIFWGFKEILYRERLKNEVILAENNRERQEALHKEKLEFFTNISHDLKTPLTLINDPLKRLESNKAALEDRELYFSIINRNVSNLTRMINQILDFRKSESGKLKINATSQNFNQFAEECFTPYKFIALNRNIHFEFQISETSLRCSMDFEKAEHIINNILSNAFKYTPDGGTIVFSAVIDYLKSAIEISITDNGIGIKPSELEKIFEPFNTVGPSPYFGSSSGIGLSLTRSLVEFLNGTITIESELNKGTKAFISLPFSAPENDDLNLIEENEPLVKAENIQEIKPIISDNSKPTILIVEDNLDVQTYLGKELQNEYILIQEYNIS